MCIKKYFSALQDPLDIALVQSYLKVTLCKDAR